MKYAITTAIVLALGLVVYWAAGGGQRAENRATDTIKGFNDEINRPVDPADVDDSLRDLAK